MWISDRSNWEWNLAPNDGAHQPRVLAYELVDLQAGRISLAPVYADLGASWRQGISGFQTAAGIREWLSRLKRWPWRRRCVTYSTATILPSGSARTGAAPRYDLCASVRSP
jgi:hypothetical protein